MYKCELHVGGYAYNAADLLKNWDEVVGTIKRNDYDGVVRSFSSKFEFVLDARLLLMREYKEKYLNASANIVISTRNNSWTYNEKFRCALDFSTLSDDGNVVSINAIDDSVAALVKAKKGTQYEYSVGEVKEDTTLYYDGMNLDQSANWTPTSNTTNNNEDSTLIPVEFTYAKQPFPFYVLTSESNIKNAIEFADQDISSEQSYLIKAIKDVSLSLEINIDFWLYLHSFHPSGEFVDGWAYYNGIWFYIIKIKQDGTEENIDDFFWETMSTIPVNKKSNDIYNITLNAGEKIVIKSRLIKSEDDKPPINPYLTKYTYNISSETYVKVLWVDRITPVNIDVVTPAKLLNRLLKSMNNGKDGLTGIIEPSGEQRLDNALVVPAESARKLPKAKVYCSFTKFSNWMSSVFGYVYDINGNTVTFRHRDKYFSGDVVKKIENYTNYEFRVNSALVYSGLRVGYDKQDYESTNGKDEFRFTNEYTSGINLTDNKKELISPLRADAYGIEFLAEKIGQDTTDNESDNDVFFVCAELSDGKYILKRNVAISGVISPDTMFNVMYSPTSMIEANKKFLGVSLSELTFASSDGNSEVVINGLSENRDILITEKLFTAGEYSLETSDVDLPDNLEGIIEFEHEGIVKQGYYSKADYNYGRLESSKIELIAK